MRSIAEEERLNVKRTQKRFLKRKVGDKRNLKSA